MGGVFRSALQCLGRQILPVTQYPAPPPAVKFRLIPRILPGAVLQQQVDVLVVTRSRGAHRSRGEVPPIKEFLGVLSADEPCCFDGAFHQDSLHCGRGVKTKRPAKLLPSNYCCISRNAIKMLHGLLTRTLLKTQPNHTHRNMTRTLPRHEVNGNVCLRLLTTDACPRELPPGRERIGRFVNGDD